MSSTTATAKDPAPGRNAVSRLNQARRSSTVRSDTAVARAQDARRALHSRQERFAHLKRMHD